MKNILPLFLVSLIAISCKEPRVIEPEFNGGETLISTIFIASYKSDKEALVFADMCYQIIFWAEVEKYNKNGPDFKRLEKRLKNKKYQHIADTVQFAARIAGAYYFYVERYNNSASLDFLIKSARNAAYDIECLGKSKDKVQKFISKIDTEKAFKYIHLIDKKLLKLSVE